MKTKSSYTQRVIITVIIIIIELLLSIIRYLPWNWILQYCFSISFQCSLNSQLYNSGQIKTPLAEQGRGLDENYCSKSYYFYYK